MEAVAGGEGGLEGLMIEVPHEWGRVEEVDGGYAEGHTYKSNDPRIQDVPLDRQHERL